VFGKIC